MDIGSIFREMNEGISNKMLLQVTQYFVKGLYAMNEKVRRKIQAAIGEYNKLLIIAKKKLRWYGHISRSSDSAKIILQGKLKGKTRRDRQKKRSKDL